MNNEKQVILSALAAFLNQRPGLEFCNYGDVSAYRAESRRITQQLNDGFVLLRAVEWRSGISAGDLKHAMKHAFSGRLQWIEESRPEWEQQAGRLEYCTGQYWPTEYRAAVCAVLASALWSYWRNDDESSTGDSIRKKARREFGQGIGRRWFN